MSETTKNKDKSLQCKPITQIQAIRKSTGYSQSEFAQYFHLNLSTLQMWEQGENGTPASILYLIKEILVLEGRPFVAPDDGAVITESVNLRWKEDSILYLIKRLQELESNKSETPSEGDN